MPDESKSCLAFLTEEDCHKIAVQCLQRSDLLLKYTKSQQLWDVNVVGFLGEYFRLSVCVEVGDSGCTKEVRVLRFFVKTTPIRNEEKKAKVLQFFMKEKQIYTDLFAELYNGKNGGDLFWRPKCHLAREDCLVLDDLIDLGYESITAYESQFTVSHIECILKCLAEMHAGSLISESRGLDIKTRYGHLLKEEYVTEKSFQIQSEFKAMKHVILNRNEFQMYHKHTRKHYDDIVNKMFAMYATSSRYRNVFSHGDLWASNIMFKQTHDNESPKHAVLLDFQLCRYVPPAVDVLVCIFVNTCRNHRDQHMEHYLRFYWDLLQEQLTSQGLNATEILSWMDFRESCDYYEFLAIMFNMRYAPFSNLKPGTLQLLETKEMERVCTVGRGEFILETLKTDEHFRNAVLGALQELLEKFFVLT